MPILSSTFSKRYPYVIVIPKDAQSPTNSIYQRYDIVEQKSALNHTRISTGVSSRTIRSMQPFKLRFITKGKEKVVSSKLTK